MKAKKILGNRFFPFILYFLTTFVVALCSPILQDSWTWGTSEGLRRLSIFFQNYNGRYLGNLLVIAMTRFPIVLSSLIIAVSLTAVLFFMCKVLGGDVFLPYILMFFTLTLSSQITTQVYFWIPGFCNYIPPFLFALIFIYVSIQCIQMDQRYPLYMIPLFFILGVSTQLFLENVTVGCILMSVFLNVYYIIRKKKIHPVLFVFLISHLIGCIIMFSNSIYFHPKTDYKEVSFNILSTGFWKNLWALFFLQIVPHWMNGIFMIHIVISVLCLILVYKKAAKYRHFFVAFFIGAMAFFLSAATLPYTLSSVVLLKYITAIGTIVYCITILSVIILFIDNTIVRTRLLLFIIANLSFLLPLLATDTFRDRCIYASNMCFILLACELLLYLIEEEMIAWHKVRLNMLRLFACCFTVIIGCTYFSIFHYSHTIELKRATYVQYAQSQNQKIIYLPNNPCQRIFGSVAADPREMWWRWYKEYYGCDIFAKDSPEFVDYETWEEEYYSKMRD